MATAYTQEHGEDNFVLELNRVKEKVRTTFKELREGLSKKEKTLMEEINDLLSGYNSYKADLRKVDEQKQGIENTRNAILAVATTSPDVKRFHDEILQGVNERLTRIQFPERPNLVLFDCDRNLLLSEVNRLCKLVEPMNEKYYKSKTKPILSVCNRGTGNKQLNSPLGVTVDHNTGNIYVADQNNCCVKVFDRTCKYLFKFGDKEEGKMEYPNGLVICGDRVLISQYSNCIMLYQLDGRYISKIGIHGSGKLQFNNPWGLSIDQSNGDVYVCDYYNNRIQILSKDLKFKSQFGKDVFHYPRDIKLYKGNIFILDESNPCLHIYSRDLMQYKGVISRGEGQQVVNPYCFYIDRSGNILITDHSKPNSILIVNSECVRIHKISVSAHPMGITVDEEGRIIVVSQSDANCLQIF